MAVALAIVVLLFGGATYYYKAHSEAARALRAIPQDANIIDALRIAGGEERSRAPLGSTVTCTIYFSDFSVLRCNFVKEKETYTEERSEWQTVQEGTKLERRFMGTDGWGFSVYDWIEVPDYRRKLVTVTEQKTRDVALFKGGDPRFDFERAKSLTGLQ